MICKHKIKIGCGCPAFNLSEMKYNEMEDNKQHFKKIQFFLKCCLLKSQKGAKLF